MKKINFLVVILILQTSLFSYAQQSSSSDAKNIEINVAYLRKNAKSINHENALKIAKYLTYIKLTPDKTNYKDVVSRLLKSSTQFLLCDSVENLACLEAKPMIDPNSEMRKDVRADLGKPVKAGAKLEIESYFTQAWYDNYINKTATFRIPEKTVAKILAEKILQPAVTSMSMALYGIDDLSGTMAPVYEAVKEKVRQNIPVRAVVDVSDGSDPNSFIRDYNLVKGANGKYMITNMPGLIDFAYIVPLVPDNAAFTAPYWVEPFLKDVEQRTTGMKPNEAKNYVTTQMLEIDPVLKGNQAIALKDAVWITQNKKSTSIQNSMSRITYQYNGTMNFMNALNMNVGHNEEAMAHVEYPYSGIMHNKFIVFENDKKQKSVWTGTANIAETCMGSEANANMAIYVKNTAVAEAFQGEFNEMFNPVKDADHPKSLVTGNFHNKKRPNTNRYFTFTDGTEVRVHFSPTDDAEHRVVLPMLYSARAGDIIRISMFGSGGFELVRAMQSAVARGVHIRISVDQFSGLGVGSWIKSKDATLFDKNPYVEAPTGSIEVRKSGWPGLNHHKTATLTRLVDVKKKTYRPEIIIIGSQNWSGVGNDMNDENVISISNKKKAQKIMLDYNSEFDQKIWAASLPITASSKIESSPEVP